MVSLGFSKEASWAASAMDQGYNRIVLMDQRGTGRSTPLTKQTLELQFPDLFLLDEAKEGEPSEEVTAKVEQAAKEVTDYMSKFRADNIVKDAEDIKEALMMPADEPVTEPRPWGLSMGQSFGGFCTMTYLSTIEHPPRICLLTGGIAPMLTPAFDAYTSLWKTCQERNLRYYEMYPGDIRRVKQIVQSLLKQPMKLPSGGTLTARRFLMLGIALGGSPSAFATFHSMIATATLSDDTVVFTRAFLKYMDSAQSFDDHPIYFWLHESIYGDGSDRNSPTNWAAHRAYEALAASNKEFDYQYTSSQVDDDSQPTLFFGEHVFPFMPEDFAELSGVGLTKVANNLASKTDWGPLYDGEHMRKVLSNGSCKAAAAVYHEDMYVDFDAAMKVAKRGAPLEKCKLWVSNEYQHSGLRDNGANIFEKLYGMATGGIRTPS
ncbi:proline iminopeptidase [Seminavis robusta]|uniref:Proline iminopeptidase n=1 Tax=Seminavis robusta TaxID=568900 RepID=A0A9N8EVU1_9STRA|nr:proline iminopeptidase [Seminavis robusta]|eukprot:Sro2401_g326320.1 proline iminopeptidase (434) ;mRNA; r:13515-15028